MSLESSLDSDTEMPSLEFLVDELAAELAASIRSVRLAAVSPVTVPSNLEVGSSGTDISLKSGMKMLFCYFVDD